ncbi:PEP-CTERM sorting domain-containing protein [Rhizobacter sp. LjRoot28]|jgi:hypothetical protein|uniref:PEP-CTERM sorting domain-containing protein n=1 Tax=Rhizobacter sp. LjRoot28 TaxID=3342309 RepID=UPI003ECE98BF
MHSILRHGFAVVLIASASSPALAGLPANYQATFALSPGIFGGLKTGNPIFDGDRVFTGAWGDQGIPHARTLTTDVASFTTAPDGSVTPNWGAFAYDENRDRGGLGPHSFGGTFAFGCGLPVTGCASGSHTDSAAHVFGTGMGARVSLTDLYAKATTEASWARGFSLDPYASFTFSGFATVSITGDDTPLQGGTRVQNGGGDGMTTSSMTFGDLLGRARTIIGASVWGGNSIFADIAYTMRADGLMSMTITNNSDATLLGRLNAGTYVDLSPPIPEPETWLMLLAGAGIVGAASRRRQRSLAA